jgi:hypothetical protein
MCIHSVYLQMNGFISMILNLIEICKKIQLVMINEFMVVLNY